MNKLLIAFAAASLPIAGCSDGPNAPEGTQIASNGTVLAEDTATAADVAEATASGPRTAFGLTEGQLEDAELVGTGGVELGEIDAVVTDASGNVTALRIEIEDTTPDREVDLPLDGLRAVRSDDDWDVQSTATRDQLMAMPEAVR